MLDDYKELYITIVDENNFVYYVKIKEKGTVIVV